MYFMERRICISFTLINTLQSYKHDVLYYIFGFNIPLSGHCEIDFEWIIDC